MKLKTWISGVLAAAMVGTAAAPVMAREFPDTAGHWAQLAISTWSDYGVINGDNEGNFRPNESITRAETATVLDNMIGYEKESLSVFSDVAQDDWFAGAISRLYEAGVITGYEDGTIQPRNGITRQEAAVMMSRALGLDTAGADVSVLAQFNDRDSIGDWASGAVAFMTERGYIQGSDGLFRPGDPITRAELVTMVHNMVAIYANGTQANYSGDFGNKLAVIKGAVTFEGVVLGGAVISPRTEGKVNFNSGTVINGTLLDLSTYAVVGASGATIASQSAPNKTTNNNNNNNSSTGGYSSGSSWGGSSGSSWGGSSGNSYNNNYDSFDLTFDANGGEFENGKKTYSRTVTSGNLYGKYVPDDPTWVGYEFMGWYTTESGANKLSSSGKVDLEKDRVSPNRKRVYAGWQRTTGRYGGIKAATGSFYGKTASDLMSGVKIEIERNSDTSYQVTEGSLKYVTDYQAFNSATPEGYFLALTYTLPEDVEDPRDSELWIGWESDKAEEDYHHYTGFTNSSMSYSRVFYITRAMLTERLYFKVDLDGKEGFSDSVTIQLDLSKLKLLADTRNVVQVSTEEDFRSALAKAEVTDIVVEKQITLANGQNYTAAGDTPKRVTLSQPILLPAAPAEAGQGADVTIGNLRFVTDSAEPVAAALANTAGTKAGKVVFENNAVGGGFTTALDSIAAASLTVTGNSFDTGDAKQPAGTAIAVAPAEAEAAQETVIKENSFNGYATAVKYSDAEVSLKQNKFLENTCNIQLPEDTTPAAAPDLTENYFAGTPGADGSLNFKVSPEGAYYMAEPYYTDEACKTLSENRHDAWVEAEADEKTTVSSLLDGKSLVLGQGKTAVITVYPKDTRDWKEDAPQVSITVDEAEAPEDGNTVTVSQACTLHIAVGGGEAVDIEVTVADAEVSPSGADGVQWVEKPAAEEPEAPNQGGTSSGSHSSSGGNSGGGFSGSSGGTSSGGADA